MILREMLMMRVKEYGYEMERLKMHRRNALQRWLRAGWSTEPNPYFLEDLHTKLAVRLSRRAYHTGTNPKLAPAFLARMEARDRHEIWVADLIWQRMADKQRADRGVRVRRAA
jgi:hypothetical protein